MLLQKTRIIPLLICVALFAASCGTPSAQNDSDIATAVALTVQAQNALTKSAALPTLTPPLPTLPAASTPEPDSTNTPVQEVSNPGCITSAELISENPPDDTVFLPGEYFYKTWTFLNTGTCTWDKSFSLVFWDGERMGGLISYPMTEKIIKPQETMEISIYLQAPATEGTTTGYWRLKAPWGTDFGVGPLDTTFYVRVAVSVKPKYAITRIDYQIVRDPPQGCPLNVRYIVYATVTTNGPLDFAYFWDQSDGNETGKKYYQIEEAGSVTFKRDWLISLRDSPNPRWVKLVELEPVYRDFGSAIIDHDCFKLITPEP